MAKFKLPHDHGQHIKMDWDKMPGAEHFQTLADIFKLLGDGTRLRIFWLLCHCEECVINISAMVEMSSPAVSHHLRLLRDSGLVTSRREGKEVYYKAAGTEETELLHHTIEHLMAIACPDEDA